MDRRVTCLVLFSPAIDRYLRVVESVSFVCVYIVILFYQLVNLWCMIVWHTRFEFALFRLFMRSSASIRNLSIHPCAEIAYTEECIPLINPISTRLSARCSTDKIGIWWEIKYDRSHWNRRRSRFLHWNLTKRSFNLKSNRLSIIAFSRCSPFGLFIGSPSLSQCNPHQRMISYLRATPRREHFSKSQILSSCPSYFYMVPLSYFQSLRTSPTSEATNYIGWSFRI